MTAHANACVCAECAGRALNGGGAAVAVAVSLVPCAHRATAVGSLGRTANADGTITVHEVCACGAELLRCYAGDSAVIVKEEALVEQTRNYPVKAGARGDAWWAAVAKELEMVTDALADLAACIDAAGQCKCGTPCVRSAVDRAIGDIATALRDVKAHRAVAD